jgi:hypothetical protein
MMFWWLDPQCTSLFLKTTYTNQRWWVKYFLSLLIWVAYFGTASSCCMTSTTGHIHCYFQWNLLKYLNMLIWNTDEILTSARNYQLYVVVPITTNGLTSCCRYKFSKSRNCVYKITALLPSSWLILQPWRWRHYIPPKCLTTSTRLHSVTS